MGDSDSGGDDPPADRQAEPRGRRSDRTVTAERGRGAWTHRRYRLGVVALGVLGVVFGVAGVVLSDVRTVLVALSGTGLFGAVLLYVLVPERFVTATLARRTYAPLAEVGPLLVDTAGLSDRRVYVPDDGEVRLVVASASVNGNGAPSVDGDDGSFGGLSLPTTGDGLLAEFRDRTEARLATDAADLLTQLLDALVEEFELIERASGRASPGAGEATVALEGSCYGPPTTFDHPVPAFLAAGLAAGLELPVTLDQPWRNEDGRYVVRCRWHEPVATADEWDRSPATDGIADWEFPIRSSEGTEESTKPTNDP